MSFLTFAKCRPATITLTKQANFRQCLCECCTNVSLSLTALSGVSARIGHLCCIMHEKHAVDVTTCDNKSKNCCYRSCNLCSVGLLDQHTCPRLHHDDELTWHRWESRMVATNGKQVNHKMLVAKQGNIRDLLSELKEQVAFLSEHLFCTSWQHKEYTHMLKRKLFPSEMVLMVLDLAENCSCNYQEEVQAAHWFHEQVTADLMVTYYKCLACEETVCESLVFISPDRKPDYHVVWHFTKMALNHL